MITFLLRLAKKAWYTRQYSHVLGMTPSVARERWNMPHPVILFRDGHRANDPYAVWAHKGRLLVSTDSDGRICEVWDKE